ncbi:MULTISPECIES: antibiotic biosynthesis monooxygenase family protein [Staphylococcus]|uniref:antibiotic biosynthesis monooxygenase family protein n=1 Tax=Staphylococcus TaxID=1279 RepID=UPI00189DE0F7|nr:MULTISPECIES: antibiotic biosynthesis monooxygenase [Staphylococcus]MBF7018290.1 antibiotic biosynthesis monooxygenase [Staphylococcus durrellii]MCE5008419.1 antibiotic biosynthesis monooxygenase [Staphylococcus equorum]MDG0838850.1 antibiotic biosynthesis monooxygenase [Staphylococcus equorum]MDK9847414.1 antibiotic biosynthesis monooxygenase [Staphylococcus equorum]MDK9850590.1 antibiotic biosynthesis monooxygenase [Staphylococcus equorum]
MLQNSKYRIYLAKNNEKVIIDKFNTGNQYTILEQIKDLPKSSYTVLNHLYVNPGFEEEFERVFLNRNKNLKKTKGFRCLLLLKPHNLNEHYVIATFWENQAAYKQWQDSREYKVSHKKRGTKKGIDQDIVNKELSFNISLELI